MEREFGVKLKVFFDINIEPQHSSVSKVVPLIRQLDTFTLFSLYSVS
jgi:hypothetical protein